ncbi:conserved hypothetical protein [Rippkaea orientalis PCC 8801]|uniref:Lysozyme inhibitor LprI N-terminal domain-containing protein n=1 Tax=Rippkaea orientalis (strain PCC 8801 / RF-1) TaxID=41431 RepID=B7K5K9_RIPO1|nr:hypothetical protein [Rippkaea orientalis]ACK66742.1 conserved hypothetical protein [Rippkaea orientalis PCC 8801]
MKPSLVLLVSGIFISVILGTSPSQAQVKTNQVNALVEALRQAAPPNRPNDGMYSDWQVLPGIIPDWSKRCAGKTMTPEQFEKDPKMARQVVSCIVKRELQTQWNETKNEQQAVRQTACWWMTGKPKECQSGTLVTYVQKVLNTYQKQLK